MATSEGHQRFEGLVEGDERFVATHFQEEEKRQRQKMMDYDDWENKRMVFNGTNVKTSAF